MSAEEEFARSVETAKAILAAGNVQSFDELVDAIAAAKTVE